MFQLDAKSEIAVVPDKRNRPIRSREDSRPGNGPEVETIVMGHAPGEGIGASSEATREGKPAAKRADRRGSGEVILAIAEQTEHAGVALLLE